MLWFFISSSRNLNSFRSSLLTRKKILCYLLEQVLMISVHVMRFFLSREKDFVSSGSWSLYLCVRNVLILNLFQVLCVSVSPTALFTCSLSYWDTENDKAFKYMCNTNLKWFNKGEIEKAVQLARIWKTPKTFSSFAGDLLSSSQEHYHGKAHKTGWSALFLSWSYLCNYQTLVYSWMELRKEYLGSWKPPRAQILPAFYLYIKQLATELINLLLSDARILVEHIMSLSFSVTKVQIC